ncbi:uncharacterized protein LOC128033992 [Gossypium raimondii]|uniref:uncharacterized protein LOC128033992 n=1 Tax=Gossypium raimondii TaxID=29730 RepID=UPI00227D5240|nr:uncharacterized protein LOC128033992 [Gossypium raimondii]
MVRSREESLEQRDQMAKLMEMMTALVKGKGPIQSPDIVEPPQSRANQDPLYPPGFTPPHVHAMQRGYPQREPTGLEQHPAPSAHLGQGMFVSNPGANPSDPIVSDLDDPVEIARLRIDDNNAQDKYRILEERIKAVEGAEVFSALSAKELSLVPDLVLPPKFKTPNFEKYDGTRCPKAHLIMFCRKMTGYVNDDKLLVHCFQDSLVGSTLRWYNQLSRERIRSWKDLASAFCEQYRHVSDMVPDRLTLQMMEKKPTETFRQYAQRWRDISAQVEPPLTKTEITVLFINTLKAPFYDKLVGSATKDFADIVISGELIENAVKSGRMEGPESSKTVVPTKKKEAEAHMVGTESHCAPNSYPAQSRPHYRPPSNFYFPPQGPYHQAPSSYPVYAMNNQRPFTLFPPNTMPTQSQPKNDQRLARPIPKKPQFTPIPVPYEKLYLKLLEKQLISPHYMAPLKPPYPKWYDPNANYMYHAGNQGHSTENCLAFKKRVQDLINAGILRFDGVSNPLPNHADGNVNVVTNEDGGQDNPRSALIEKGLQNISLNAINNENDEIKNASMIRPCPPGYVLNNWTAVDLLVVSKSPSECSDINGMNNPVMNPEINFEKVVCLGEFEADENVEDCVSSPDLLRMVEQEEKQILPHQESVEVVNLGSEEEKQEVKIGTSISENTRQDLITLLHEYKDVFAWSYQDMPGLNTDIVVHKLPLKPECKPV